MRDVLVVDALGRTPEGREVERYSLRSGAGLRADVMSYGATLMRLEAPDRNGRCENIVLGFDALAPYLAGTPYFGATIGRYANRIAGARFALDGRDYPLAANDGCNHLHGGVRGFDKAVWDAQGFERADGAGVVLRYVSADGEEGYPGELEVEVAYELTRDRLTIAYRARATKPTHVNLTHHSYFNLSGAALRNVETHELTINADRFMPVDEELIPVGDPKPVEDTPFDFRTARLVGARIGTDDAQLRVGGGYDHTFVLNKTAAGALGQAALLRDPASGRAMEVWTTEPGLQFYSGNHLDGAAGGFGRRAGLCLEPQHFPNSPNRPDFPSTLLRPGDAYGSRTEFVFTTT
ncbi:MAG TPA: aldose epimerase family protein [Vitreimonas sp.]|uniref:aldose epimerase family protein n=1 Tax=Vitreimonas sp. TaxID=3069702 RepID=UPI002D284A89|nr:aldose epimerase family protein [Vitreimonas sp.]HYD88056.1 aldose epimerase family protein [Vitreimonas sp.]